jgi:2'-5' RNA ligase
LSRLALLFFQAITQISASILQHQNPMLSTNISTYSLAISPSSDIIRRVREFNDALRKELGKHDGSENSVAHLTLFMFQAYDQHYSVILSELKRVLAGLEPFKIEFSGFAHFPSKPDSTFYIKPDEGSTRQIIASCKKIRANFSKSVKGKYTENWEMTVKDAPHMSVAHKLHESEIQICYALFQAKGFDESFACNSFVIRKLNLHKGQYDIVDTIPLLGHEYMVGQQMRLF